jgi:CRISPR-associated Csx3 family protein
MRVIVLRKQFVEDTPTASETEQTTSGAEPRQISEPKPILLHITLSAGLIETDELEQLLEVVEGHVPAGGKEPVIISGRLPVWAFGALVHHFHARPWVATFDPRYGAGIIAAAHVRGVKLGQRFPVDEGSVTTVRIVFPPEHPKPAEPTGGE